MGLRCEELHRSVELDIDADEELSLARMHCTWKIVHQGMHMVKMAAAMLEADMRLVLAVGTEAVVVVGEVEYRLKTHKYVVGYRNLKLVAEVYTAGQVGNTSKPDGQEILLAEEVMMKDTDFAADFARWVEMGM